MSAETWSYDGSFEGLLTLVARALDEDSAPAFVVSAARAGGLFDSAAARAAPAEEGAAERVMRLSRRLYAAAARAWMSEEAVEPALLAVAVATGRRGEAALGDFASAELRALAEATRRVNRETHRLEGFARFTPGADGLLVALLEPDHNVLPALAPYFQRRFGREAFALVDLARGYALVSRPQGDGTPALEALCGAEALALAPRAARGGDGQSFAGNSPGAALAGDPNGPDSGEADEAAALWKRYFAATENPARRNPRLQRQLMPSRYWKHLTEMEPRNR
ncbi:MAG: TIGR03915 family putative DNA repair protein [Spirochaetaceae bacterium]|nr:TIGR03915 family putative DNA repair protein [Spirochaetaceae bacterium]